MSQKEQIGALRTDVEKAVSLLEGVRQGLATLGGEESPSILEPPEWERSRLIVWAKIYDAGGIVDQATMHKFAREAGYDPRGLAGFFRGKGSLVWVGKSEEGKVALANWASEEVERYREWIDKQAKKK